MVKKDAENTRLKINAGKMKTLVISNSHPLGQVKVDDRNVEDVEQFVYLGSPVTNNNDYSSKIKQRVCMALGALEGLQKIWNSSAIGLKTKLQIIKSSVFSVLLYASETWNLKKADINKLTAFEMMCYCRILKIEWFHHVTNEKV